MPSASPSTPTGAERYAARALRWALPALILGAIGISFSPIFVRLSELGPTATAFHRVFLAWPILALWLAAIEGPRASVLPATAEMRPRDVLLIAFAGFCFAGDLAFWHWSVKFTSVANATFLSNLTPFLVTLSAWLLFRERITGSFLVALALGFTGMVLMMWSSFDLGSRNVWGDVLGVITAFFYTAYLMSVKAARARASALRVMAWSSAFAALFLLPVVLIFDEALIAQTWAGWAVLAGIAMVSHVGGQGLIAYSLAHLPASFSSLALLTQPVAAAVFAWLILGEALGIQQGLGALVVLAGILLARRASLAAAAPESRP